MKIMLLVLIVFLFACNSKKQALLKQQEEISLQIDKVKSVYFKTTDSLDQLKRKDTAAARQEELMQAIITADQQKSAALLKLQKRYHMVELQLRNY